MKRNSEAEINWVSLNVRGSRESIRREFFMQLNYAIVFVSDMKRSVSFYRDAFGLPLRFESPGWTEFATEGATLALHSAEPATSEKVNAGHPSAGRCRPGLSISNINDFHERLVKAGVRCIQPPTETFGVLIAQYLDPDGLEISVSEDRSRHK